LAVVIQLLCSIVLSGIVFALSLVSRPAADPAAIIEGSRRTFLPAASFLAPKMLFPWWRPRWSGQFQDFFPSFAIPSAIKFEDIAQKAGVHFVTENCPTPEKHPPEDMPAGIALFDYDGDGLFDMYLVNGAEMPWLVKSGGSITTACSTIMAMEPSPTSLTTSE
jgi:hypothetical protein